MNRPLISVMSIVDLLQQDNLKDAARLMAAMDQDQGVMIALELVELIEPPVIRALRKAVQEVKIERQRLPLEPLDRGDLAGAEVSVVRPVHSLSLFAQKAGRLHDLNEDQPEMIEVTIHDGGNIHQFGPNVFVAWDETGAGIACAESTLEDCRRQLRAYAAAISGD